MGTKVSFKIDLQDFVPPEDLDKVTKPRKKEVLNELTEFLIDSILTDTNDLKSSVTGKSWKSTLSPEYKKIKEKEGGKTVANLQLSGDMLRALKSINRPNEPGIVSEIGIFKTNEAVRASGHSHIPLPGRGESKLPRRQFLPVPDSRGFGELRSSTMRGGKRLATRLIKEGPKKKSETKIGLSNLAAVAEALGVTNGKDT